MKTALVCGGAGFLGGHLVARLKSEGYWVRAVDRKYPEFADSGAHQADELSIANLSKPNPWVFITPQAARFDEVYQLACDMGGMGFLGDSRKDAEVLSSNALINLMTLEACREPIGGCLSKVFFASSACVYPESVILSGTGEWIYPVECQESHAYPAQPDLEYGWEKLFSERLYAAHAHRYGIPIRIARFHNVFGPVGTWRGGREKAPAAICRKVAEANQGGLVDVWGDGQQTRSFLYVDEAIEGVRRLMHSEFQGPVNIGSSEMVNLDDLVSAVAEIAGKVVMIKHVPGPVGVCGRNSDNTLIREKLNWAPSAPLKDGLEKTYRWIEQQVSLTRMPT